jgi:hypothetical protein
MSGANLVAAVGVRSPHGAGLLGAGTPTNSD